MSSAVTLTLPMQLHSGEGPGPGHASSLSIILPVHLPQGLEATIFSSGSAQRSLSFSVSLRPLTPLYPRPTPATCLAIASAWVFLPFDALP